MNILTIAGSDPSSGAGIQSDIKTFSEFGCHGFTAITAITSQNSSKFSNVTPIEAKILGQQIDSILSDFQVNAIKIGMVFDSKIIKEIHKKISKLNIPIVVDPVIKSTTGGILLQKNAIPDFKKLLLPLAIVITPNKFELEILSGIKIKNKADIEIASKKLQKLGVKNVAVTGICEKDKVSDYVFTSKRHFVLSDKKILNQNHGSGCNYSAALIAALAKGNNIEESAKIAKKFAHNSIKNSTRLGKGVPLTKIKTPRTEEVKLRNAITEFSLIKDISKYIPECQTNFVYAVEKPKSIKNIFGLDGRIVKAGNRVIVAGEITLGGSKHVASAVLQCNKKFPMIRSAVNIKFDEKILSKMKKKGFKIKSYNRDDEPKAVKAKENSSIIWGIKNSLKNSKTPPDVIYHKGDYGKEPMIIVFGKEPEDVINKISKIV